MNPTRFVHIGFVCPSLPALAQLPKRKLSIEPRQEEEGDDSGYVVSSQADAMAEVGVGAERGAVRLRRLRRRLLQIRVLAP